MDDVLMQDAIDRYLRGEMTEQERLQFDNLRQTNPEVDQTVVSQTYFLREMETYGQTKAFIHKLHEVESQLGEEGLLAPEPRHGKAQVINLWKKYRLYIAVAACIGGISALCISGLMIAFSPKHNAALDMLSNKMNILDHQQRAINQQLNEVKSKIDPKAELKGTGTSFLIDGRGYLITNAHVIRDVSTVYVQNRKGDNFKARIVFSDPIQDLAILKIDDSDFHYQGPLPYGIKRSGSDLGESIFTLGYPRPEIVLGEGYLSAKSGYNGDSSSYQIYVPANPGNSGGPVLNNKGEVIGILSTKQREADGAVFALKSRNIYMALDSLKRDTTQTYPNIRVSSISMITTLDRTSQIKKIEDYIYMVKGY
jgi:serine protease Do